MTSAAHSTRPRRDPAARAPIPRGVLFGQATRTGLALSPDGRSLAWLERRDTHWQARMSTIENLAAGGPGTWLTALPGGVEDVKWAADGAHLLLTRDPDGDERTLLSAVAIGTGSVHDLTPPGVSARLLAVSARRPGLLLAGVGGRLEHREIGTGARLSVRPNPGFFRWIIDHASLEAQGGLRMREDGGIDVCARVGDTWPVVLSVGHQDAAATSLARSSPGGRYFYLLTSAGAETARLVTLDTRTGRIVETLAEAPDADVCSVWFDPMSGRPRAAAFSRARKQTVMLDRDAEPDAHRLCPDAEAELTFLGGSDDDRRWLGMVSRADRSPEYRILERAGGDVVHRVAQRPELAEFELATPEPFEFLSRDGLTVHGYATFPPAATRERPLPTVLLVHGGPWERDTWRYDGLVQLLADRGYLCLQVNFRGSTGYGKAFLNAGDREWAGLMHQDLVDAVGHATARRWADPANIAIMGASYGGYAALVGAAFTPDLFRCAVDLCGPANLATVISSIPAHWTAARRSMIRRVGDPETEPGFCWERSPLSRIGDIKIPLLIAHGGRDIRVRRAESEAMVDALRQRGVPHRYLLYPEEGHFFRSRANWMHLLTQVEEFLAEHLGGVAEEPGPESDGALVA
ncbi:peptidase S9 [Sphaerisporangium rufum]|uniref:Peptidase S9 n=1 Tax=Sphaerisporangium rufum TaxID=1381558 RepID=A0A919V324_9ACTN|nr:S9 family peptidase [Sphaerisporangium rufum]GII75870.1 peptidase S9 [Sphaerisporangium rufum]